MMLKTYVEGRDYLESFIPLVYGKEELGLARIENLLSKLGNPQKKFRSILVAGTSGKGSTAYYISRLLLSSKFQIANFKSQKKLKIINKKVIKVGLHVSPHLVDIRERLQLNGKIIPMKRFVGLVNRIKPVIDDIIAKQPHLIPSYFEILVAMTFLYFAQEKVDWAVVEVGLGGRLDATNVLDQDLSVITNVGLDHTDILGKTVEKIAWEKAGIIKAATTDYTELKTESSDKNKKHLRGEDGSKTRDHLGDGVELKETIVVTGASGKALKVIEKVAKSKKAQLITLDTRRELKMAKSDLFRYIRKYYYLFRSTETSFAAQNKNLALLTVLSLGIIPDADVVKKAFPAGLAGRIEQIDEEVVLDGAHNPDKVRSLIEFLISNILRASPSVNFRVKSASREVSFKSSSPPFDQTKGKQGRTINSVTLVLAFKQGKAWRKMVDLLIKNLPVNKVIATEYQSVTDTGLGSAVDPKEIAKYVKTFKGVSLTGVYSNSQEAIFEALASRFTPGVESGRDLENTPGVYNLILVTGSLYLVGEARTIWHLPHF